jgi:guanylate kinase
MPRSSLFILSSPSGGGKTTLADDIVANNDNIDRSISYTTRDKRINEIADKDYYFIAEDTFLAKSNNGDFLESAIVFGHHYGTCANWVSEKLAAGIDIICTIDCVGASQIKSKFPDAVLIFIMPPSKEALVNRLQKRASDSTQEMIKRLSVAKHEVMQYKYFDYIVVNDSLELASKQITAIVKSNRLKVHIQKEIIANIVNSF